MSGSSISYQDQTRTKSYNITIHPGVSPEPQKHYSEDYINLHINKNMSRYSGSSLNFPVYEETSEDDKSIGVDVNASLDHKYDQSPLST